MKILYFAFILLFVQCTTTPKKQGRHTDQGIWTGKVQMVNHKNKNRKWANVTWVSDGESDRMRIDVTAILDVPVATFLKDSQGVHLWLFTNKRYYHSLDGRKLFKHLTKFAIDPSLFYSLLGDPKDLGSQWECADAKGVLKCQAAASKTHLNVLHKEKDERVIKLKRGSKSLRIRLYRSKVEVDDRLFQPLPTSQFKTLEI